MANLLAIFAKISGGVGQKNFLWTEAYFWPICKVLAKTKNQIYVVVILMTLAKILRLTLSQ